MNILVEGYSVSSKRDCEFSLECFTDLSDCDNDADAFFFYYFYEGVYNTDRSGSGSSTSRTLSGWCSSSDPTYVNYEYVSLPTMAGVQPQAVRLGSVQVRTAPMSTINLFTLLTTVGVEPQAFSLIGIQVQTPKMSTMNMLTLSTTVGVQPQAHLPSVL